jgi:thiosulfate dehydrogenase [quinone] large subunit
MALTFGQGLALLRIGFGLYFLSQAIDKLKNNWLSDPAAMAQFVSGLLQRGMTEPFYRPFLEGVVLPHGLLFSQLVTIGELLVGVSLILGLLTRLGALGSSFLVLNYMLMKGLLNNAGSSDRLFLLASIVFILTSAGLVWGLDGRLREVLARNSITRWIAGLSGPAPRGSIATGEA